MTSLRSRSLPAQQHSPYRLDQRGRAGRPVQRALCLRRQPVRLGNVLAATGGAVPQSQYFLGRLSNGPNYADRLAIGLGSRKARSPEPSLAPGQGSPSPMARTTRGWCEQWPLHLPRRRTGGRAARLPLYSARPRRKPQPVAVYALASGMVADPNALYVVWTGGGDLRDAVNYVQQGNEASAAVIGATAVDSSLSNISGALATLEFMGAKHVLVPNVPDLGRTPETRDWTPRPRLSCPRMPRR